jgi:hypothetical protein
MERAARTAIIQAAGERFLDEHVQAAIERGGREPVMRLRRRGDHGRVQVVPVKEAEAVVADIDLGVRGRDAGAMARFPLGDREDPRASALLEGPDEMRTPVASADHGDPGRFRQVQVLSPSPR